MNAASRALDTRSERVPCVLCGELGGLRPLFSNRAGDVPCHVSICPNDGLVFLSPRWKKQEYDRFYRRQYDDACRPSVFGHQPDEQKFARGRVIYDRLGALDLIAGRKRILDVGAGMGWTLEYMKRQLPSADCAAIEPSQHCARHITESLGFEVLTNDAQSAWPLGGGAFDLVIMRHVLEHFLDPVAVLTRVRDSLAEDGTVYIAVPDMMRPHGSLRRYWYRGEHTFYFSSVTLEAIAARAGLHAKALQADDSELWGAFGTGSPHRDVTASPAHYEAQMALLSQYTRRSLLLDARAAVAGLLPRNVREWSRKLLFGGR
jgi:SAM-dependent methyltransferase